MKHVFVKSAHKDYIYWAENDKKIRDKINDLITDIKRNPYSGLGKPEPLKHQLRGFWSRRITQDHRLVYKIIKGTLVIVQCRVHYE